jgi:hypothetical protein
VILDELPSELASGPSSALCRVRPDCRRPKAAKEESSKYLSPETSGLTETVDEQHTGTTDITCNRLMLRPMTNPVSGP